MNDHSYFAKCLLCGKNKQFGYSGRKVQLFRFPQDVDRCRAWVRAIGIRTLLFTPIDKLRQQVLCADHFDPQCINEKFKRLHKVAIPKTPLPSLPDALMNDFPRKQTGLAPAMHNFRDIEHPSSKPKVAPTILNGEPVIDFGRPLMNSLETLLHNERHAVVQPAGTRYNTISVPLMSYSSSLEKGNVFAADYPGNAFKLPLPIIEAVNHDYNVAAKQARIATNQVAADAFYPESAPGTLKPNNEWLKDMTHSSHTNAYVGSRKPNSIISEQGGASTANEIFKKPLGTVKPTLNKAVNKAYKIPKLSGTNVSFGLKTLIKGSPRKANRNSNVIALGATVNPSTGTTESRYQGIRQYTNNKLTIHKNIPLAPIKPATAAPVKPATVAVPQTRATAMPVISDVTTTPITNKDEVIKQYTDFFSSKTLYVPSGLVKSNDGTLIQIFKPMGSAATTQQGLDASLVPNTAVTTQYGSDVSLVPNATSVQSREATASSMSMITFDSPAIISTNASLGSPGPTENELVFVPYSQYEGTVSPDSINAHTAEGTEEYGLPLMNCVGTVFQGNIHYTDKIEEASDTIDVPLMCCLKTLENSSIP